MSPNTKTKSIFSGLGGLIGALAGVVTVAVGLLTVGSQLGWFDSDSSKSKTGNETTAGDDQPDSQTSGPAGSAASTPPQFSVDPRTITFQPGQQPTEKTITLRNTGKAPFIPGNPDLEGSNPDEFGVSDVNCAGTRVQPGSSCQVKVEFEATQMGTYDAEVVIPFSGSDLEAQVVVEGERGLLN